MFELPRCLSSRSLFYRSFPRKHILKKLKADTSDYFENFSKVLKMHLTSEFEVTLQGGEISKLGRETLSSLSKDFEILQYASRITEILK